MGSVDSSRQASRLLSRRFEEAAEACRKDNQFIAILFIDECDALLSSDEVAGMLASLLDRAAQDHEGWERIIFVAATNHADKLPFYLRRPGRFDKEISVPPPRAHERLGILELLIDAIANISPLGPQSLRDLAGECVGYVAADLVSLVRRVVALVSQGTSDSINLDLFRKAMLDVRASALRDYSFVAPKKIKWSDVAGDPGRAQVRLPSLRTSRRMNIFTPSNQMTRLPPDRLYSNRPLSGHAQNRRHSKASDCGLPRAYCSMVLPDVRKPRL